LSEIAYELILTASIYLVWVRENNKEKSRGEKKYDSIKKNENEATDVQRCKAGKHGGRWAVQKGEL